MKLLMSLTILGLILVGCDRQQANQARSEESGDAVPATLLLTAAPDGAGDVKAIKAGAKQGDEVVMRGVIGGRADPIAANRAIFTLLDATLTTCDEMTGDTCKTPWDACCEDSDDITAGSATVQVVDAQGRPLRTGLAGHGGIAPLKEVVVVGTVREADEKNLVVDATGIYVKS